MASPTGSYPTIPDGPMTSGWVSEPRCGCGCVDLSICTSGEFDQHPFSARINGAAADQQNGTCGIPQRPAVSSTATGSARGETSAQPWVPVPVGACVEVAGRYIDGQIDLRYARFTRDGFVQCPADRVDGRSGRSARSAISDLRQRWQHVHSLPPTVFHCPAFLRCTRDQHGVKSRAADAMPRSRQAARRAMDHQTPGFAKPSSRFDNRRSCLFVAYADVSDVVAIGGRGSGGGCRSDHARKIFDACAYKLIENGFIPSHSVSLA